MKTRTILAALVWALAFTTTVVNAADALPSWNDGTAEQSIADFFAKVNKDGSPDFVPPAERIAVFDNDSTLWAQHPEWKDKEPFASLLKSDLKSPLAQNEKALIEILMATHGGMTTDEFDKIVKDWLATTKHPKTGRPSDTLEMVQYARRANRSTRGSTSDCRRICCPCLVPINGPATSGGGKPHRAPHCALRWQCC
jgi:hypothetical protein